MVAKKPTPRGTKVFAAVVFGGLAASVIGQRASQWTLQSQTNTLIVVAIGAIVAGAIAWLATRPKA